MTTQAVQESLSGAHAPMSKVFPGKITTTVGTRNAYVQSDGDVVVMCVGEDAEERAKTVARAIASHDKLVAMARLLQPAFGVDGIRFTITPDSFNRLESLLRPPPVMDRKLSDEELQKLIATGASEAVFVPSTADDYSDLPSNGVDDICFNIGAAVRRRNRSLNRTEQPIAPSCELAATDLVLKALAECGYKVTPPPAAEAPGEADHLCKLALADVLEECNAVRAELKAAGHAHEGHPLHRLVDAAIDRERCQRREEVAALKDRLARIRFVAA